MPETTFYRLPLLTEPGRVMTPRPASEQLVATALAFIGDRPLRVVDVGTGSGALAIAIASAAPSADLWATDTSPDAVRLARENVALHGLEDRVTVRHGNLIDPVPGEIDLVVANLPYLPLSDERSFPELADEPREAVFAHGDGLDPYRRLLDACSYRLSTDGAVAFQLHRRVLAASAEGLHRLKREL